MDLDFSEEQHLLRDMVRAMLRRALPDRGRPPDGGRPEGLSRRALEAARRARARSGMLIPEAYGGSAQSLLDAAIVYEELGRALAPTPHFVVARCSARRPARRGQRRAEEGVAAADRARARRSSRPPGSSPTAASARRACSSRRAPDGRRLRAHGHQAPRALRARRRRGCRARAHRRRARRLDLFLVDPHAAGRDAHAAAQPRAPTRSTDVDFDGRARARRRRGSAPRGTGWDTWDAVMHDGIILLAAQAIGGADRALEITVAVREGPQAVRQAARRVPVDLALPGRHRAELAAQSARHERRLDHHHRSHHQPGGRFHRHAEGAGVQPEQHRPAAAVEPPGRALDRSESFSAAR